MNKRRHLCKAAHNENFFSSLDIDKSNFPDWIVVGIFYAALHYYESYFSNFHEHSSTHDTGDDLISKDKNISNTYEDYRELKQYRWQASYKDTIFSADCIKNDVLPKYNRIKEHLQSL